MLLITLLDDNEAKPPIIVAYLRKRNVVLSHCYKSANVIEPREPHTCNNIKLLPENTLHEPLWTYVLQFRKQMSHTGCVFHPQTVHALVKNYVLLRLYQLILLY
jgi:hypothetical protein